MNDLTHTDSIMDEIRELLVNARQRVAAQVNTELLSTYWNVGRIIIEHEQKNKVHADYGKQNIKATIKRAFKRVWKRFFCFQSPIYAPLLPGISNSTDSVC